MSSPNKSESEKLVLAVSGKGGVGKSTLSALLIRSLSERGIGPLLAVDANPDSNLPHLLGVQAERTVADLTSEMKEKIERGALPPTLTKKDLLEYGIIKILKETTTFDLLVMGRGEGEGCYCMVNKLLTDILDTLSRNYRVTIIDEDAGLEHLSRRTDRDVDVMLIVTDPSSMGFRTASRIKEVAREVHLEFRRMYLVGNRFSPEQVPLLEKKAAEMGLEVGGFLPHDENVFRLNLSGRPLSELPPDSPSLQATERLLRKLGLLPDRE
ncbi:MAG: P-loop NTPase [Candidatus Hadarchaeales archaeon]